MPRKWKGVGWNKVLDQSGVSYANTLSFEGKVVTYAKDFVAGRLTLLAVDAQGYRDIVAQLGQNQLMLYAKERFGRIRSAAGRRRPTVLQMVYFAILVLWLLISIAVRLRR